MTHVSEPRVSAPAPYTATLAPPQPRRPAGTATAHDLALSVLVPTRNEAENVEPLLARLGAALDGLPAEVIFVDDSDDATPEVVASAMRARPGTGPLEVSLLHRPPGARDGGLGGAVVAGLARARGTWACVMDGDLQHPPEAILAMLAAAEMHEATLVIASRYGDGGDAAGLSSGTRRLLSRVASGAANALSWRSLRP